LVFFFGATSETFFTRFNTMEAALLGCAQHPLLGVGLNNGTASMKASRQETATGNLSATVRGSTRTSISKKACRRRLGVVVADVAEKRRTPLSREDSARVGTDKVNAVRSEIPAVTHVDYSARLQTVHRETNARYHALITAFKATTGRPVLVNTSFNVRGEPIACTPEDAFRCLMGTEIEVLVVGDCLLRKERQDPALKLDYRNVLDPDRREWPETPFRWRWQ
jgi:Carbamoyltransferase C-terminus